ncbi:MAG: lytic murein transglycosylase B [Pseudomonadota bacterium]
MKLSYIKGIFLSAVLVLLNFLYINIACADKAVNTPAAKAFIQKTAKEYKIDPSYIRYLLRRAKYLPQVIPSMEAPPEKTLTWYQYRNELITPEKIADGIKFWDKSNKLLDWAKREYGVPQEIILAIIGIESNYGKNMGRLRVLDVLTTLAFYYPPREKFYRSELAAFIALAKTLDRSPFSFYGSYGGAMGMPQFMPSNYLYYGVDFHGSKYPNIFKDKADAIFSVANFLRQKGWEPNEPIILPAKISGNDYRALLRKEGKHLSKPKFNLRTIAKYGVVPEGFVDDRLRANLIVFTEANDTKSYWLALNNFYTLKRYNNSNLYAMAVYSLGQQLRLKWDQLQNQRRTKKAATKKN